MRSAGSIGTETKLDQELLDFTRFLIELRQETPGLSSAAILPRSPHSRGGSQGYIVVFGARRQGVEGSRSFNEGFSPKSWCDCRGFGHCRIDTYGNQIKDNTFLILVNAHHKPRTFVLPATYKRGDLHWELSFDTRGSGTRKLYQGRRIVRSRAPVDVAVLKLKSK